MMNTQLSEYIKKQLAAGVARGEIERTLTTGGGWSKSDVDEAFSGIIPIKLEPQLQNIPIAPSLYKPAESIQSSQAETSGTIFQPQVPQQNVFASTQPNLNGNVLKSSIDLLKESVSIYKNKFGSFLLASLPILVAMGLLSLMTLIPSGYFIFVAPIVIIVSIILSVLSTSSILFVISNREKVISFSEIIYGGFSKLLSVVWITIISSLVIFGGSVLLIIPGLIFSIWFSLSLVVLFAEDKRGMDALLSSKEHIKGYWGNVAWRLFVFGFIVAILSVIIMFLLSFISELLGIKSDFLSSLLSIILTPLTFIYSYLLYENLKKLKNGVAFPIGSGTSFVVIAVVGCVIFPLVLFLSISYGLFSLFKNADINVDTFSNINIIPSDTSPAIESQGVTSGEIDISSWNAYKNDKYGLSFKYPQDSTTQEVEQYGALTVLVYHGNENKFENIFFSASVSPIDKESELLAKAITPLEDTTLNGYAGREFKTSWTDDVAGRGVIYNKNILLKTKDRLYNFYDYRGSSNLISPDNADFVNILPTIKINDEIVGSSNTQIASWETYKNDKYGFEINYPSNWTIKENNPSDDNHYVVYITNPLRAGKPDTDTPMERVLISVEKGATSVPSDKAWEEGFGLIYYTNKLFTNINGVSHVVYGNAFDSDAKKLIDQMISSFKFSVVND